MLESRVRIVEMWGRNVGTTIRFDANVDDDDDNNVQTRTVGSDGSSSSSEKSCAFKLTYFLHFLGTPSCKLSVSTHLYNTMSQTRVQFSSRTFCFFFFVSFSRCVSFIQHSLHIHCAECRRRFTMHAHFQGMPNDFTWIPHTLCSTLEEFFATNCFVVCFRRCRCRRGRRFLYS